MRESDNNENNINTVSNPGSVNTPQTENNPIPQENVIDPVKDVRDLGDKTIDAVENFINTEDHAGEHNKEEMKKYKTSAMLCYIPLLVLFFVLTNKYKESKYFSFHANQGLITTLFWVFSVIASNVLKIIFTRESMILDNTPMLISFICYILYCASFALTLFGIINVANDASKELPVIGKMNILK